MVIMNTIASISTPSGAGGLGVIRISGEDAATIADRAFRSFSGKKIADLAGYTAIHGEILDGERVIDEVIALRFRAPHSYTGEDVVEISCHGGIFVTKQVLRRIFDCGAFPAEAGEFTKRAFLHGKIDLTEAEGVMQIISAKGMDALNAANRAKDGSLSRRTEEIRQNLISLAASLAVWADYPEDDLIDLTEDDLLRVLNKSLFDLDSLLKTFDSGKALTGGVETVICGKPNVGKSALMNRLVGRERSIVTEAAGTTRDIIDDTVLLGNVLLHISDTAGIRATEEMVEKIGVERARSAAKTAALIFAVFDLSREWEEEDEEIAKLCEGKRCIAIFNKADLKQRLNRKGISHRFDKTVVLSAKSGEGMEELEKAAEELLGTDKIDTNAPMLTNERQYQCVKNAKNEISEAISAVINHLPLDAVSVNIDVALDALSLLTGEKVSDAVVNEVFRSFCVGK